MTMKLVEVELLNEVSQKHLLFRSPAQLSLNEEDIVRVETVKGDRFGVVCSVVACDFGDPMYNMATRFAGAKGLPSRVLEVYTKSIEIHWPNDAPEESV